MIRIVFVGIFSVLIGHMYSLQINNGEYYFQRTQAREEASGKFVPTRGVIYITDKHQTKIPAVVNKEYPLVYAVPKEIEDPQESAHRLASIIGKEVGELVTLFSKPKDEYELLIVKATPTQVSQLRELNEEGIYIKEETFRFYPLETMAAHLFGFISPAQDGSVAGRYGVELEFEDVLRGVEGSAKKDNSQNSIAGSDLYLTIDRNIQAESERILGDLFDQWGADGGSVIVQEPSTGKILAMANAPTFDPNTYSQADLRDYLNGSVELLYEPGSVFKVLTIAAGIDSGAITPQTTYVDKGYLTLNGRTIRNWDKKTYGLQTMTNVIENSLNTGSAFAESKTGHKTFTAYIKKFGFGVKTGIELPGEISGDVTNLDNGRDINYATASFGQGISVTPIQLISSFSAIANGGVLMRPIIRQNDAPEVVRRVVRPETAQQVIDMMVSAVDKNILAHVPQYRVAGKTGTANIPNFRNGGYTDDVINTFVGFAPAQDPKFVVLIKLDNPKGAPLAGQTVVPAFKKMTQFLLNYYEVPPDRAGEE